MDVLGFYIEHLNPMYQNKTRTNLIKDKVIFGKIDFFVLWGKNIWKQKQNINKTYQKQEYGNYIFSNWQADLHRQNLLYVMVSKDSISLGFILDFGLNYWYFASTCS